MAWVDIRFAAQVDDPMAFMVALDEERLCAAFPPAQAIFLTHVAEKKGVTEAMRTTWRRLRRSES